MAYATTTPAAAVGSSTALPRSTVAGVAGGEDDDLTWLLDILRSVQLEQFFVRIRDQLQVSRLEHFEFVLPEDLEKVCYCPQDDLSRQLTENVPSPGRYGSSGGPATPVLDKEEEAQGFRRQVAANDYATKVRHRQEEQSSQGHELRRGYCSAVDTDLPHPYQRHNTAGSADRVVT